MKNEGLCAPDTDYLVGFCCLHTLQLILANALAHAIGVGGLGNRNAVQLIHAMYDLQESMEFGLWKMEWEKAAKEVGHEFWERNNVPKMPAPIITRWWTIGEAAVFISKNLAVCRQVSINIINWSGSGSVMSKANKIASGLYSLFEEKIIVSDVILIDNFHQLFVAPHFKWMQNGDKKIGNSPGFLGRHMFSRYFLMSECLQTLKNNGWKEVEGMSNFSNYVKSAEMQALTEDPSNKSVMVPMHEVQVKKTNAFFDTAFDTLEKHYTRFSEELFFLSLYDECHASSAAAKLLQGEDLNSPAELIVQSPAHDQNINLHKYEQFLKLKVDVQYQLENTHVKKCEDVFQHLIGKKKFLI